MDQELCIAVKIGDLKKVKYIVSLGTDIRINDDYTIKLASLYGHLEMVKYLVSLGADIQSQIIYLFEWLLEMVI